MRVKLLKKLRKRFIFHDTIKQIGFVKYNQWVMTDIKKEQTYEVGTHQAGLHLALFISGYKDDQFKSKPWKENFQTLKSILNASR